MKKRDNILDLEKERRKRKNPSVNAVRIICALEDILEDSSTEDYVPILKEFIVGMDLGNTPITALARTCQGSSDLLRIVIALLSDIPLSTHVYLLEYVEKKYPKDAMIIKRLQIVIMTFSTRNLSLQKLDALFPNAEAWILNYLLGHDKTFEQYALKHDNNIVLFPKD